VTAILGAHPWNKKNLLQNQVITLHYAIKYGIRATQKGFIMDTVKKSDLNSKAILDGTAKQVDTINGVSVYKIGYVNENGGWFYKKGNYVVDSQYYTIDAAIRHLLMDWDCEEPVTMINGGKTVYGKLVYSSPECKGYKVIESPEKLIGENMGYFFEQKGKFSPIYPNLNASAAEKYFDALKRSK
jgi:hypothetical protein